MSGGAESCDGIRVMRCHDATAERAADLAAVTSDLNGRFHRERQAGERAGPHGACLRTDALRVEVDQGVQDGVEPLDLPDVFFREFERGDGAAAQ